MCQINITKLPIRHNGCCEDFVKKWKYYTSSTISKIGTKYHRFIIILKLVFGIKQPVFDLWCDCKLEQTECKVMGLTYKITN